MTKFEVVSHTEQQNGVMRGFLALYLGHVVA